METTRTALVVGGTSGIGLAAARRLTASGHTVHVASRSKAKVAALAGADPYLAAHVADGSDKARRERAARELCHLCRHAPDAAGCSSWWARLVRLKRDALIDPASHNRCHVLVLLAVVRPAPANTAAGVALADLE